MGIQMVNAPMPVKKFGEMKVGELGTLVSGTTVPGKLVYKVDGRSCVNLTDCVLWRWAAAAPMESWTVTLLPPGTELVIN